MISIVEVDALTRQLLSSNGTSLMVLKAKTIWSDRMFGGFIVEDTDENKTRYQYNRETKAFEVYVEPEEVQEG